MEVIYLKPYPTFFLPCNQFWKIYSLPYLLIDMKTALISKWAAAFPVQKHSDKDVDIWT